MPMRLLTTDSLFPWHKLPDTPSLAPIGVAATLLAQAFDLLAGEHGVGFFQ